MKKSICLVYLLLMCLLLVSGCGPTAFVIKPVKMDQSLEERVIQQDEGWFIQNKVAVIDVDGIMMNRPTSGLFTSGENPVSLFVEKLDKAKADQNVKAVVLRLNTPGGTVAASDMMYQSLLQFRQETKKPVVACMLDVAASGGYYLACGCDGIVAGPGTVTGSIGTIMQTVSFEGIMNKLGIQAEAIKSGELKDIGSPFENLDDKERAVLQGIIDQFYQQFLAVVKKGRAGKIPEGRLEELADGRVFTGRDAQKECLVDRIGYPDDAIKWAKMLSGLEKTKVVIYHRPIHYKPNVYGSATLESGVGALVNVELPDWLQSSGLRFLYLWTQ